MVKILLLNITLILIGSTIQMNLIALISIARKKFIMTSNLISVFFNLIYSKINSCLSSQPHFYCRITVFCVTKECFFMQKLAAKLIEVMKECSHVTKAGINSFHGYKYATSADVLEKVNASLTKNAPLLLSFLKFSVFKMSRPQRAISNILPLSKSISR